MAISWNQDQLQVIQHRDGSLLVSAAAGSGKTTVMIERLLELITDPKDPVDVDELLVLTFTNMAAAQMKDKLYRRLAAQIEQTEDLPVRIRLSGEIRKLKTASITTIDAFCRHAIETYVVRIPELDAGFTIADEIQNTLLEAGVMEDMLESFYQEAVEHPESERSQHFTALVTHYSGTRQDQQLETLVTRLSSFLDAVVDPEDWLETACEAYHVETEEDLKHTQWYAVMAAEEKQLLEKALALYQQVLKDFADAGDRESSIVMELKQITDKLSQAIETGTGVREEDVKPKKRMSYSLWKENKDEQERVKRDYGEAKDAACTAAAIRSAWIHPTDIPRMRDNIYPAMLGLKDLVLTFRRESLKARSEDNMASFADLERYCLKLFRTPEGRPTQEALEVRDQFRYICIDEYQDSNEVQEAVISSFARYSADGYPVNLFMVGDVKQSIYRFRQARPELFLDKLKAYPTQPDASVQLLHRNFRSRPQVLEAVNDLFFSIMRPSVGEILYDEQEALVPGRRFPDKEDPQDAERIAGKAELHVFSSERMTSEERKEQEARWTARQIQTLVMSGRCVVDEKTGTYRPVRYGDIVILARSPSKMADVYTQAFEHYAVPYYSEITEGFYQKQEVQSVLNVLRIIDNPRQDIPLVGVLYSPMWNLSGTELARIRLSSDRSLSYYEQLKAYAENGPDEGLREKIRDFFNCLNDWREASGYLSVAELITEVLEKTGYDRYASSMADGDVRHANLELLIQRAEAFEEGNEAGLYRFLRYIDRMEEENRTEVQAQLTGDEANVVRIMSIHKSKGLEFPVVFLCDTAHQWNFSDTTDRIQFHQELGMGVCAMDDHYAYETLPHRAIAAKKKQELLAEEMRVLYVAMTRAGEMLYVTGSAKKPDFERKIHPGDSLPDYEISGAKCYLDWLLPVALGADSWQVLEIPEDTEETMTREAADEAQEPQTVRDFDADSRLYLSLTETLSWQYACPWQQGIPAIVTVSQLKKAGLDDEDLMESVPEPLLVAEDMDAPGGAKAGTAIHKALSLFDLSDIHSQEDAFRQLQMLKDMGKISEEESASISKHQISLFADSTLLKDVQTADRVLREQPFIIRMSIRRIHEIVPDWLPELGQEAEGETVMVQGIIDLCYEKNGLWYVVDFKSDRRYPSDRMLQYARQLTIYALAIEQITQSPVADMALYQTRTGQMVRVS